MKKFYREKNLKLAYSEKEYKMIMKIENNDNFLQILLNNNENLMSEKYYLKITLEEFKSLSPFFRIFESILVCAESLANIIRDSNPRLSINDKDAVINVKIYIPGGREEQIELVLKKIISEPNDIINNLLEEIAKLKTAMKDMQLLLNEKDRKINEIQEKCDNLKKSQDSLKENHKKDFNNLKSYFHPYNQESTILKSSVELNFLSNKFRLINQNRNVKYYLLYRKSRDSDNAFYFHSRCDKIKGTLVLIETEDNLRIGGYTSETWEGNNISKKDNTAFIFSLNNNKEYNVKNNLDAIYCTPNYGPCFCGRSTPTLFISNNCDVGGGECCKAIDSNYNGYIYDYEINNEKKNFKIKEYEVFEIKFE